MGEDIIPQVCKFKYMGSILQNDGKINEDVTQRMQARWLKWRNASRLFVIAKYPPNLKANFIVLLYIHYALW